jgi:hypothetical protein
LGLAVAAVLVMTRSFLVVQVAEEVLLHMQTLLL